MTVPFYILRLFALWSVRLSCETYGSVKRVSARNSGIIDHQSSISCLKKQSQIGDSLQAGGSDRMVSHGGSYTQWL